MELSGCREAGGITQELLRHRNWVDAHVIDDASTTFLPEPFDVAVIH